MSKWKIINSVYISKGKVFVNNELKHSFEEGFPVVAKDLLNIYAKGYGKFFKMDKLSKLGFISAEILYNNFEFLDEDLNEVALVIGNSESTIPTDCKYFESIKAIPSPGVFVYTLPNILIGEICLRKGFKGENLFFISKDFDVDDFMMHINTLINNTSVKYIIAGWVNFNDDKDYLSNIYLFSQGENGVDLSKDILIKSINLR